MRAVTAVLIVLFLVAPAEARWRLFRPRANSVQKERPVQKIAVQKNSPQAMANYKAAEMARRRVLVHLGGGFGYGARAEGIGCGMTAASAIANCCFARTRVCIATAVVQGSDGRYYACRMYR